MSTQLISTIRTRVLISASTCDTNAKKSSDSLKVSYARPDLSRLNVVVTRTSMERAICMRRALGQTLTTTLTQERPEHTF